MLKLFSKNKKDACVCERKKQNRKEKEKQLERYMNLKSSFFSRYPDERRET